MEGLKSPRRFAAVARKAAQAGKPLIVLKLGRSEPASRASLAHTGSITGSDAFYDALFARYGVLRAVSVEDLLDQAMLFSITPRRYWPAGPRVGIVSVSGGAAGVMADLADAAGMKPPTLSAGSVAEIASVLSGTGLTAQNPMDLSGQIQRTRPESWPKVVDTFLADESIDSLLVIDAMAQSEERVRFLDEARRKHGKAVAFVASSPEMRLLNDDVKIVARELQIPVLSGLEQAARAAAAPARFARKPGGRGAGPVA